MTNTGATQESYVLTVKYTAPDGATGSHDFSQTLNPGATWDTYEWVTYTKVGTYKWEATLKSATTGKTYDYKVLYVNVTS